MQIDRHTPPPDQAELVEIEGMGHDLPGAVWPQLTTKIAELVMRCDSAPRGSVRIGETAE